MAERVLSEFSDFLILARPRILSKAFMQEFEGIPFIFAKNCGAIEVMLRAHSGLVEASLW